MLGEITRQSVYILWRGTRIGTLTREMNDACEDRYIFKFYWDVVDELGLEYDDVDGVNLSLRKDEYVRNFTPAFITENVPPKRPDSWRRAQAFGMTYWDIWDFMIRIGQIANPNLSVELVNPEEITKQLF